MIAPSLVLPNSSSDTVTELAVSSLFYQNCFPNYFRVRWRFVSLVCVAGRCGLPSTALRASLGWATWGREAKRECPKNTCAGIASNTAGTSLPDSCGCCSTVAIVQGVHWQTSEWCGCTCFQPSKMARRSTLYERHGGRRASQLQHFCRPESLIGWLCRRRVAARK